MDSVIVALVSGLVGALLGVMALVRWYGWRIKQPEVYREILKRAYQQAHPHWFSNAPDDPSRICPCCGWEEKPLAPIGPTVRCGIRVVHVGWATLDEHQAVGTRIDMAALADRWRAAIVPDADSYLAYEVRIYNGLDPASPENMAEYLSRGSL